MRGGELLHSLKARARNPGLWAMVLGGSVLWAVLRLLLGGPYGRLGHLEAFLPLPLLMGTFLLGPIPWQMGAGPKALPHPVRGLLQALPWNAAWIVLLLMGLQALHPPPPRDRPPGHRPASFSQVLLGLFLPMVTAAGGFLAYVQAAEARADREKALAEETRQLALQAQMQPHALYNAISGLAELAREDGRATEAALVALSRYLRFLQQHCQARTLPLAQERQLVEAYLAIAQVRLGSRLQVAWQWPEWADDLELPPLLLQPLVENAVEHGLAARAAGGLLRVSALRQEDALLLEVANQGAPLKPDASEGQGLGHLRERLALWSPARAELTVTTEGEETVARILLRASK